MQRAHRGHPAIGRLDLGQFFGEHGQITAEHSVDQPTRVSLAQIRADGVERVLARLARSVGRGIEIKRKFFDFALKHPAITEAVRCQPRRNANLEPQAAGPPDADRERFGSRAFGLIVDTAHHGGMVDRGFEQ